MPDISMCSSTNCPVAASCKRHEASGTRPNALGQRWDRWHWRRSRSSDDIICNGFQPALARTTETADG